MKKQSGFNPLTPPKAKAAGHKKKGPGRTAQSGFNPLPGGAPKRGPGAAAGLNPLPVRRPGQGQTLGHAGGGGVGQTLGRAGPLHAPKPKRPKRRKPVRKLAGSSLVACCAAEAVAVSLRLAGQRVSDDEVVNLYRLTGAGDDDQGASIEDTLHVAAEFGMAGCRPVMFSYCGRYLNTGVPNAWPAFSLLDAVTCGNVIINFNSRRSGDWPTSVLLGLDLPEGPHAVYATEAGWWSWGELYPASAFSQGIISEAWAVTW